jgi:Proline utilization A proline dehydrogenase N-terminal domain
VIWRKNHRVAGLDATSLLSDLRPLPCRARSSLQRTALKWADGMPPEFPATPPAAPLAGRGSWTWNPSSEGIPLRQLRFVVLYVSFRNPMIDTALSAFSPRQANNQTTKPPMSSFQLIDAPGIATPPRDKIAAAHRAAEPEVMARLMAEARLSESEAAAVRARAAVLAQGVREARASAGGVNALMLEFSLDSRKRVALIASAASIDSIERARLMEVLSALSEEAGAVPTLDLPGPTGESNRWSLYPRGRIGCIADSAGGLGEQIIVAVGTGNRALVPRTPFGERAATLLGATHCEVGDDVLSSSPDAIVVAGDKDFVRRCRERAAASTGKIVPVIARNAAGGYDSGRLLVERVVTINTTASGGNAELLAIAG